jgi:hypothetical protein
MCCDDLRLGETGLSSPLLPPFVCSSIWERRDQVPSLFVFVFSSRFGFELDMNNNKPGYHAQSA